MKVSVLIISICTVFNTVQNARILGIFPFPSISHQKPFLNICKELSLRGHQVTAVTPNPLRNESLTNLTEIDVSSIYNLIQERGFDKVLVSDRSTILATIEMKELANAFVELILSTKEVQDLMNNQKTHFDLIIAESHSRILFAFGEKYKAPVIGEYKF